MFMPERIVYSIDMFKGRAHEEKCCRRFEYGIPNSIYNFLHEGKIEI